jgi:uncharacterized protein
VISAPLVRLLPSRQREGLPIFPPSRLREGLPIFPPSRLREGLGAGLFQTIRRWTRPPLTPPAGGRGMLFIAMLVLVSTLPLAAQTDRVALVAALRTMAAAGDAEAAYHLGMMRHLGIGGLKDEKAAFEFFKQAADSGDPLGAYKLGDYYARPANGFVTEDRNEALRLKTIAAEAGYALAQHDVARLHFDAGDMDSALEWLLRSAQQGHTEALRALASLYNSDAIPKDAARTYAYYSLFLKRLAVPTDAQKGFLNTFAETMSEDDRVRGDRIVADWIIEQTDLTKKAQSGLRAAESLVKAGTATTKEEQTP